jgi:hypothetical protein
MRKRVRTWQIRHCLPIRCVKNSAEWPISPKKELSSPIGSCPETVDCFPSHPNPGFQSAPFRRLVCVVEINSLLLIDNRLLHTYRKTTSFVGEFHKDVQSSLLANGFWSVAPELQAQNAQGARRTQNFAINNKIGGLKTSNRT